MSFSYYNINIGTGGGGVALQHNINRQLLILYYINIAGVHKIIRDKAVRLIRKHSPKTDKFSNVNIITGRNHGLPKGIKSGVLERESIFCLVYVLCAN